MKDSKIGVVGIALRYPDASSPDELPPERMRAEDYYSTDPAAPDRHYTRMAAVLEGFEFDRVKYRIGGTTFRSTDMTHWLALDTVTRALEDAGFPGAAGLPRATTGVIIGNTLTGEFSRANLMRLRWPYVRRTVGAALKKHGWDEPQLAAFLGQLEERYKSPFQPINEDTLAGGLANTISGRVCNYYDLGGGGFTVDGACSSSLLATATIGTGSDRQSRCTRCPRWPRTSWRRGCRWTRRPSCTDRCCSRAAGSVGSWGTASLRRAAAWRRSPTRRVPSGSVTSCRRT